MDAGRSGPRLGAVISGAAFGSVAGHILVYLLAIPNVIDRRDVLRQSGHGAWPGIVAAGLILGGYAAISTVLRSFREGRAEGVRFPDIFRWTRVLPAVGLLQVLVFFTQEMIEHLSSGVPLSSLGRPRFLILATVVQFAVGALVAATLFLLARTAALVGAVFHAPVRPEGRSSFPLPVPARRPTTCVVGGSLIRGPPLSVAS